MFPDTVKRSLGESRQNRPRLNLWHDMIHQSGRNESCPAKCLQPLEQKEIFDTCKESQNLSAVYFSQDDSLFFHNPHSFGLFGFLHDLPSTVFRLENLMVAWSFL